MKSSRSMIGIIFDWNHVSISSLRDSLFLILSFFDFGKLLISRAAWKNISNNFNYWKFNFQATLTMPTAKAGIRSSPRFIKAAPLSSCLAIAGLRKRDKVTPLCVDSCEPKVMGRSRINNLRLSETVIFLLFSHYSRETYQRDQETDWVSNGNGFIERKEIRFEMSRIVWYGWNTWYTWVIHSQPRNLRQLAMTIASIKLTKKRT